MSAEQFETFKSKDGYTIEDTVGKSGLEATMESYLRGKCGEKRLEISKEGKLLNTTESISPVSGNTPLFHKISPKNFF
jgi:penicillin-binding protein 2